MNKKIKELYDFLCGHPDIVLSVDEPMSKHTSFKIGGPAELFCELKNENVLARALSKAHELGIEPFVIGNGSNLLVDDRGLQGAVFKVSGDNWTVNEDNIVVSSGASLIKVANAAKRNSLSGLEFAYGIPGTVGGAVYMNAGAYDGEMSKIVETVTYMNDRGNIITLKNSELEFGYRMSYFKRSRKDIILSTKLKLSYGNTEEIQAKMQDFMSRRKEKQPLDLPSAGSVFKRPEGYFAGTLIEQSGLKGYTVGGAQVSKKHAGFIVNIGGATCDDVLRLIEHIQKTVACDHGVNLECEVQYAPFENRG